MNGNQQPNTQKQADKSPRKPFGPFLIFTAVLLLLLVIFGPTSSTRDIKEDEFWYLLYTGGLEHIEVVGTNRVTGTIKSSATPDGAASKFSLTVPSTTEVHQEIRNTAAKARNLQSPPLGQESFLRDVAASSDSASAKLPVRAYPLEVRKQEPNRDPFWRERFFVDYQDSEGNHYAEIQVTNPAALRGALVRAGAEVEDTRYLDTVDGVKTEEGYSFFSAFLYSFGPILLFIALFWFIFMRQMRGQGQGLMSFGRSRALLYNKESQTNVTFEDVAGIDEAKEEVKEIIEFLRSTVKFQRLGGRIPRGVLLVGPPGAGKTLLAKAIAGEAEVPFLSISGSDFVEMFVGVGASRVRDLFKQAKDSAPCIVFLDEIDAVGRKRGSGMGGGHDEREQTLNAILVEMDGFGTDEGIIVIAATNRPDVLDPALLRPGRFDREIVIDLPDVRGREKILKVHSKSVKLGENVQLDRIARGTPGFSGAELAALVNEAAIIAVMHGKDAVTQEDLEEARDKVRFGRQKKSRVMDAEDKRITAYHEAGHAVVSMLMERTEPVHKVTIIPRGMALGATMMLPEKDRMHLSRKKMLDDLTVAYGGRVAEDMFCDDITAGAANDIQFATHMAKLMVTEWGMSERLGPVNFADRVGSEFLGTEITVGKDHSEATVREIDEEVSRLLREAHERARAVLAENREAVERVAEALLVYETIHGDEVRLLIDGASPESLRPQSVSESSEGSPAQESKAQPAPRVVRKPQPFTPPGEEGLSPA